MRRKMEHRVTIVANADSFWTQRYIKNVSLPLGHRISLVSASNEKYKEFYAENNISVLTTENKSNKLGHKINALMTRINTVNAIKNTDPELVVVHYAYNYILQVLPLIQRKTKTIITYWGSDLLRSSTETLLKVKKAVKKADCLVAVTEDVRAKVYEVYGSEAGNKTKIIDMGVSAFSSIDKKRNKAQESKQVIAGQNAGKTIITIGYNAGRAQQHDKILRQLSTLTENEKNSVYLVLPMTYQREDKKYLDQVDDLLLNIGIDYIILRDFMNDDEIADLCLATDIFINAQITDALSSSMLEHIYAGSVVINGKWLKYSFLEENQIHCYTFENLEDLKLVLRQAMNDVSQGKHDLIENNCRMLNEKLSWETSRKKWEQVYQLFIK